MITRLETNCVIFHHSLSDSATVDEVRTWHIARGFSDIGYHYLISRVGNIQHGRALKLVGAHTLGRNYDSIGVCLEGDFRRYEPTIEQLNSCVSLYHSLCRFYSKTLDIQFHRNRMNPCPGAMLNRDDFLEIVKRGDPFLDK